MKRNWFPSLLLFTLLAACGGDTRTDESSTLPVTGESLFNTNCALCHGRKGDLGMSGAKDLTKSVMTREEMIAIVTKGRNGMMPYEKTLKPEEIEAVVDHARELRTKP